MTPFQYTYPDGRIDTRPPIFHEPYAVTIPYLQMRSVEDIEFFGVPTTGIPEIDRSVANTPQRIMIPISAMAEYFKQGAEIGIVYRDDTKRIYNAISAHLSAWKEHLLQSMNVHNAPLEDLLLLDRLAHVVYDHAKYHFQPETINSIFSRMSNNSLSTAFKRVVEREEAIRSENGLGDKYRNPKPQVEEDPYPKRQSLSEYFGGRTTPSLNTPSATQEPAKQASFADLLSGRKGWGR